MKEMTLKDIQGVSLDILQDIHDFCIKNEIKYTLGYGTLIGAIRHKGFIPWDDDIDIIMLRPDFERFFSTYKSEKYVSYCPNTKTNILTFGRVCDQYRTHVESKTPWSTEDTGVWIDIFPYDGLPSDINQFREELIPLQKSFKQERDYRIIKASKFSKSSGLKYNVTLFLKKIMCSFININNLVSKHVVLAKAHNVDECDYVGAKCYVGYGVKEHHSKESFNDFVLMPFENRLFYVCNGYNEVLTNIYGDYMELPPVEQRVPKQSYIKFYWR